MRDGRERRFRQETVTENTAYRGKAYHTVCVSFMCVYMMIQSFSKTPNEVVREVI
jgi:hypothetical protein